MNKNPRQHAEELNKGRRRKRWWVKAVSILAAFTVFCTTYSLIIPVLTVENDQLEETGYLLATEAPETTTGGAITVAEIDAEEPEVAEVAEETEIPEETAVIEADPEIIAAEDEVGMTEAEIVEEETDLVGRVSEIRATAEDGAEVVISGELPYDAEAVIFPVEFTDEDLIAYFGEELAASMKGFVAYDISIWSDGVEWQPNDTVSVQVIQPAIELAEEDTLTAVHFDETEEETALTELVACVNDAGAIEFEAEGFSVYAFYVVTKTVEDGMVTLEAVTDDGLVITVKGTEEALPYPAEELHVGVTDLATLEDSELLYSQLAVLEGAEISTEGLRLLDITLWHDDEQIEPDDTVTVTVSGMIFIEEQLPEILHITDDGEIEVMTVELTENGLSFETDGFSTYTLSRSVTTSAYVAAGSTLTLAGSSGSNHSWTRQSNNNRASISGSTNQQNATVAVGDNTGDITFTHSYRSSSRDRSESITLHIVSSGSYVEVGNNVQITGISRLNNRDVSSHAWTIVEGGNTVASINGSSTGSSVSVKGLAAGDCVLKHTYSSGGTNYADYYLVTVRSVVEHDVEISVGGTYPLDYSGNGTFSNTNYTKADVDGENIVGYEEGTCEITQTYNGNVIKYHVTVTSAEVPEDSWTKTVRLVIGTSYKDPSAAITVGEVWASNNPNVATVSEEGLITAAGVGSCVVTHTYDVVDDGVTTTFTYVYNVEVTATADDDDDNATLFPIHKQIDYLGDGQDNPDTTVDNGTTDTKDLYRLYLDMTGKQEPVDLMIVVDGSGSMRDKSDVDGTRRDYAVTDFLNGARSTSTEDGFINYFLELNENNTVSVVQFYGDKSNVNSTTRVSSRARSYNDDSKVLLGWTGREDFIVGRSFVDCTAVQAAGTNYEAGLMQATHQLSEVSNDGHKKMMLFMSDGVPTFFMIDQNDVGTNCGSYTITSGNVGYRWGDGKDGSQSGGGDNYPYCVAPTKRAVDDFIKANPGITIISIGVSSAIDVDNPSSSQSPEVLRYMANKGHGFALSVTESMATLRATLESVFYPKGVIITDTLSKYVSYYADQPDLIVTMTEKANTDNVITLYKNGSVTAAGEGILTRVDITPGDTSNTPTRSTGTISAVFDGEYQFSPEYTYTMSFNVETTQTAYDKYAADDYDANGDDETDYLVNDTSSRHDGFFSNDSAVVSYDVSGKRFDQTYRKPVVQVDAYRVVLRKIVDSVNTSGTFGFDVDYVGMDGEVNTTASLKHYTGVSRQKVYLVKKGEGITIEETTSGYETAYRIDDGNFTEGTVCSIDEVTGPTIIWFRNTPVDLSQFIKVQKKFVGIAENQIPAEFHVTVTSKDDTTKTFTLKKSGATVSRDNATNTTTLTWTLAGVGLGDYTITEDNYSVNGYTVSASGTGETVTVSAATLTVTGPDVETTCSHNDWEVDINGDNNVMFAATLTDGGVAVISRYPLSESEKANVRDYVTSFKKGGGVWVDPVYFYSVQEQILSGQGLIINDAEITYNSTTGKIWISDRSNWQMCATCWFSVTEAANNPEILITNTYSSGFELPCTGGIGTTIFYIVGSILLVAAVVLLVTRKRMGADEVDETEK